MPGERREVGGVGWGVPERKGAAAAGAMEQGRPLPIPRSRLLSLFSPPVLGCAAAPTGRWSFPSICRCALQVRSPFRLLVCSSAGAVAWAAARRSFEGPSACWMAVRDAPSMGSFLCVILVGVCPAWLCPF
ncbi:hypothetical protein BRADI_5g19471v3 [Brachypodium distachyon]|uniref:Uncharacterized protein n=1 Tax=Brachypodium distachyon TaxID=15368 RepID=A0A2K2CI58_BRADI|nr:hypothetical protein BRADI_5g19471v3 [Brachypodium distachyon]